MLNLQRYVCLCMICRSQNGYKRVKMATAELEGALLEQRERAETDAGTS